jgi:uncharacterized protein
MKLHQQATPNVNTIRAFEPGSIRINSESYASSLILTADNLDKNWPIEHPEQLCVETIRQLLAYQTDIILIGTGHKHHLLDPLLSLEAIQQGVGIEIMTTEAACRTYNILLGEDRAVLAALIVEK